MHSKIITKPYVVRWVPVLIGIATIPFIVEPIDHAVTVGMDYSVRKFYTK